MTVAAQRRRDFAYTVCAAIAGVAGKDPSAVAAGGAQRGEAGPRAASTRVAGLLRAASVSGS